MFGLDIFGIKRRRREREAAAEAERQRLRGRVGLARPHVGSIAEADRALALAKVDHALSSISHAASRSCRSISTRSVPAPAPATDLLNPLSSMSPLNLVTPAESYSSRHDDTPAPRHDSTPSSRCSSDDSWSRSSGCDASSWGGSDSSSSSSSSSSDSSY